jgi:uncharacterized membrane protein
MTLTEPCFGCSITNHEKATFLCSILLGGLMMTMRRLMPFTIVMLLLLQTLAVNFVTPAQAASGRGGTNDDFTVKSISVGNASTPAVQWVQSDGSVMEYIFINRPIEITVAVQRYGQSGIGEDAPVRLDVVHPIGFVMESFNFNTNLLTGGQSYNHILEWTPTAAHSVLNTTTNDLSGGLILRATVTFDDDDKNENDQRDKTIPIAIAANKMEDWAANTNAQFLSGKYPADGGDAIAAGSWQTDATSSAAGNKHWRHSSPGSNYPSNAEATRLVYARYMTGNSCDTDATDPGLTQVYQAYLCRVLFYSNEFVSSQFHIQAWGSMAAGDSVSMELWRGSGNINDPYESISWDISQGNPSAAPGQWTNLSWDPQETWLQIPNLANPDVFLGGNSYAFSILFSSDSSVASEGFHVDDFVHFGVSRVTDYTVDLQCDNPLNGYTVAPNQMASLHCSLTNNGYAPATIRIQTNVTNASWMAPYPIIRLDIEGSSNHGTNVIIPPIGAGKTIEIWANLTVPAGADVQQQIWNLWLKDASSAQLGEKARLTMDLAVSEQFSVALTSTVPLVAATIEPNDYGHVNFRLQNTGNRDAAFNLATTFSDNSGWMALIENETGVVKQNPITLYKGERVDLVLNISSPELANPGTVSFNLRATCPSCSTALFGTDVLVRNLEVPVIRDVQLVTEENTFTSAANGIAKSIYLSLFNLGNDDEQYDLSLTQSNWRLQASLAADQSPVLDAWDGESTVVVSLANPVGLNPGYYSVTVTATSVDDASVSASVELIIQILETAAVFVSNEETGQSYIPGDLPQTMSFEVRNDGNNPDTFAMSLDIPNGMIAQFTNLVNGNTPEIEVGSSYNVSVEFSFVEGTEGDLTLTVIATSNSDSSISASGQATYLVGSQDWLRIFAIQPLTISEEGEYEVNIRIVNQYTTGQRVVMDLDASESNSWFQSSIARLDKDFTLGIGETKEITLTVDVTETTLKNLNGDTLTVNLTVWARSETVSDAANAVLQVTLVRMASDTTTSGDGAEGGLPIEEIALWAVFILVLAGGVLTVLMIMRGEEEEDDEYAKWGEDGYEDSLSATYGAVASAPSVPMAMPTPQPAAPVPVAPVVEDSMPPLPAGGLPEGWTMEQWKHYGQQWLDQNQS